MNDHIHIIDQDPVRALMAFMPVGIFPKDLLHMEFREIRNGLYLNLTGCLAHNEKIRYGLGDPPKVQQNDMFTLFFLDGLNDSLEDL